MSLNLLGFVFFWKYREWNNRRKDFETDIIGTSARRMRGATDCSENFYIIKMAILQLSKLNKKCDTSCPIKVCGTHFIIYGRGFKLNLV